MIQQLDIYILYTRSYMWNEDGMIYPIKISNNLEELDTIGYIMCYGSTNNHIIFKHDGIIRKCDYEYKTEELQKERNPFNKPEWIVNINKLLDKALKKYKRRVFRQQRTIFEEDKFIEFKNRVINYYTTKGILPTVKEFDLFYIPTSFIK